MKSEGDSSRIFMTSINTVHITVLDHSHKRSTSAVNRYLLVILTVPLCKMAFQLSFCVENVSVVHSLCSFFKVVCRAIWTATFLHVKIILREPF